MKKVWIGLGIGCAALIVIVGGVMVGGAMWFGHKVKHYADSAKKMSTQMQAEDAQFKALDAKYPFQAPPQGQPLELTEPRLQAYLAVREAALPIFDDFQKKTKAYDAKYQNAKGMEALSGAAEGMGMFSKLTMQLRESYAKSLDAQKMGPSEFEAITGAIYSAAFGLARAQQPEVAKKEIAALDKQIAQTTDPQMKAALEQSRASFEKMAGNAPDPKSTAIYTANAKLIAKYKDRIDKAGNTAFDFFVTNGDQFEKQFKVGAGAPANTAE